MPYFTTTHEVITLGVYRTWFSGPKEAAASGAIYGRIGVRGMSHGGVLDLIRAMDAVMDCYGAPVEFQIAFETADGLWHDYDPERGFDEGPD